MRSFVVASLLVACYGSAAGPKAELSKEVKAKNSSAVDVADVVAQIKSTGKPGVVIVTQPWCGACKSLKKSINADTEIATMFEDFVVAYAEGDAGKQWQAPGKWNSTVYYIPRVYFLDRQGEFAKVLAPNPSYDYYFSSAEDVKRGMRVVRDRSHALLVADSSAKAEL